MWTFLRTRNHCQGNMSLRRVLLISQLYSTFIETFGLQKDNYRTDLQIVLTSLGRSVENG